MSKKVFSGAQAGLEGLLFDGMTIMSGGFGLCGIPENPDRRYTRQRHKRPDGSFQ